MEEWVKSCRRDTLDTLVGADREVACIPIDIDCGGYRVT